MNTTKSNHLHSVVEQADHNITGWMGHHPGKQQNICLGQTFKSASDANVSEIEIYADAVMYPGTIQLTLHQYDPETKIWGPELLKTSTKVTSEDTGEWLRFNFDNLHIQKGFSYGLKLASDDSYLGLGEVAGSAKNPPMIFGQEWLFSVSGETINVFNYFSLSFKVREAA